MTTRDHQNPTDGTLSRSRWLFEWEVGLLVLLVLGIYFSRISELSIRGEESRRALVAMEMLRSGSWIVPRIQGEIYLSRPPLQNWAIALFGMLRGGVDEVAARLPSTLAVLLTVVLIYGYGRTFLSRSGALLAAAAFATMGQVLELGRLAETEAVFTVFLSGSLLVWHWGESRNWPAWSVWSSGYLLAALATLAKGIQGPVYFVSSVGAYLLLSRRWKYAVSWSHLAGLLVFFAVWGGWQLPFYRSLTAAEVVRIYGDNVGMRFADTSWPTILGHLAVYPLELLVCLLPWSILLITFLLPGFRASTPRSSSHLQFLAVSLAVTFPTCWLVPGAQERYYMPLYPCFALLIGFAGERCWNAGNASFWARSWKRYLIGMAVVGAGTAAVILGGSGFASPESFLWQPFGSAVVLAAAMSAAAVAAFRCRSGATGFQRHAGVVSVALIAGTLYTGLVVNVLDRTSENTKEQIAALRNLLPEDARLHSLGAADHRFAYYFQEPVHLVSWSEVGNGVGPDVEYFCFRNDDGKLPEQLPFSWKPVGIVDMDCNIDADSQKLVVVGRRVPAAPSPLLSASPSDFKPHRRN